MPSQTELLILLAIANTPGIYGLGIYAAIVDASNGGHNISTGTLYSTLKRLRENHLITSTPGKAPGGGGDREYYQLTQQGQAVVDFAIHFLNNLHRRTC